MNHHLSNRIYLIIIVVVSMTIGFITGYLVGIKHSAAPASSEQNRLEAHSAQTQKGALSEMSSTIKLQDQEAPSNSAETVKGESNKSLESEKPNKEIKNIQHEKTPETNQRPAGEAVRQEHKNGIYTVQAGAFKNEKEAEVLKTKLEKKGYNIYILKERKPKKGVLFKVRVGDFETKKEAEIFAIKLNKTEGIQSFAVKK